MTDTVRRARCAAPRARGRNPHAWEAISSSSTSAAHRSAAMAGGARPDPFRTRKLSRRAPMVLRGQPVGEQGAADRWTALDPYVAGSGAGAPRGIPCGAPLSLFSISFSRGPRGALFSCRGVPRPSAASPGRPFAGRAGPPISAAAPDGAFPAARPLSPGAVLAGEGALAPPGAEGPCPRTRGLRPHAAPDGPPVHGGGAPGSAPSGGRPARRWRSRRHPARASLPAPGRAGRTGPRGASCGHGEGPAIQLSGAGPAFMSPFPSEKKSSDHPSSARPSPGMSLRALSPQLI